MRTDSVYLVLEQTTELSLQPLPLKQLNLHLTVNNFVVVVLKLDLGGPMTADPRVGSGEVVGYLPLLDRG